MPELALARLQSRRRLTQAAFFALFLLAPVGVEAVAVGRLGDDQVGADLGDGHPFHGLLAV